VKTVAGNAITRTSANRHGLAIANQRGRSTATRLARAFASRRENGTRFEIFHLIRRLTRLPRDVSDIFSLWPSLRALTWSYAPNMEASSDWQGRGDAAPLNKRAVLLTIPEVATALRISRSSVYRLFEGGELRWVRVGSTRRVSSAEINRFIAEHTEAAS
jgi:excisionase family DNA binding protein